jgi:hypothetical protein
MQHHNPFEKKGAKVNMNRFMSAVKAGKEQESCWTFTLFGYLITCLDQGYFKGGKFQKHHGQTDQTQTHIHMFGLLLFRPMGSVVMCQAQVAHMPAMGCTFRACGLYYALVLCAMLLVSFKACLGHERARLAMDSRDLETATTHPSRTSAAESALARSCQNQLVVASMMFSEVSAQRRQRAINVVLEPMRTWFEEQAHCLRSVADSLSWMQAQLKGSFFATLGLVGKSIADEHYMRHVGITCPGFNIDIPPQQFTEVDLQEEDWLCSGMADLALCAIGARLCRCSFMLYGWSCRSCLWLDANPDLVASEMKAFKAEWLQFQDVKLQNLAGFSEIIARSQFSHICVEQLATACQEAGWSTQPTDQLKDSIRLRCSMVCSVWPQAFSMNCVAAKCALAPCSFEA